MVVCDIGGCRQVAADFAALGKGAHEAGNAAQGSRQTASAGWWGPAQQRFIDVMRGPRDNCDDLALTCELYARGMTDFADSIDIVVKTMNEALAKARAGGLTVTDFTIVPPDHAAMVGSPPKKPDDFAPDNRAAYDQGVKAYDARVDVFNERVKVFNECSDIVKSARKKEDEAHANLQGDLAPRKEFNLDNWQVGGTAAQKVLKGIDHHNTARRRVVTVLNDLDIEARTYTEIASAKSVSTSKLGPYFDKMAKTSGANRDMMLWLVRQLERGLPSGVTTQAVPPGFADYEGPGRPRATVPSDARFAAPAIGGKAVPIIGDILTVGDELYNVARGKQTIEAGVIRSIGMVGMGYVGAAVGSTAGAAEGNREYGPVGGIIGGIVGAVTGDIQFSEGFDQWSKKAYADSIDYQYNQEKLDEAKHAPR
ncbi:hypothetical protein EV193_11092 [Herbihabitans rhizosphaerae]|uniref:Uncharacterized protein n=2 Tax=Herbihabitans rhizosphaerae TaxID=1872711 RepID=A0A4Q7KFF7_9PSEU|nr:hypothetical protein EV193_11092 [Herbihabitans rhizosphaerae]